jgi:hypothetical protein
MTWRAPQPLGEGVLERIKRKLAIPQHDYKRPVDMREFLLVEAFPDLSRWMRHLQKNGREPAFRLGEAISASPRQNVDGWAGG